MEQVGDGVREGKTQYRTKGSGDEKGQVISPHVQAVASHGLHGMLMTRVGSPTNSRRYWAIRAAMVGASRTSEALRDLMIS